MRQILLIATLLFSFAAQAQECVPPAPDASMGRACKSVGASRGVPGQFDYYSLVLSWSPAFCAHQSGNSNDFQCRDHHFGFVVHGLWPENDQGLWPQYCAGATPALDPALVAQQMCHLPSSRLVQCEWARHGTCTGLNPEQYFGMIDQLAQQIKAPALPSGTSDIENVINAFRTANPSMAFAPESILPRCEEQNGQAALKEVRLCLDKEGQSRSCRNFARLACQGSFTVLP